MSFKSTYKTKIIHPIVGYLKQGANPNKLSLTIVLGISLGIIPLLGVNTAICLLLSVILRLNVVIIQLINYVVFPLQLLLIVPFFKIGESIFGSSNQKIALNTFSSLIGEHWLDSVKIILSANLKALLVWIIIVIPLLVFGYFWTKKQLIKWNY